MAQRPLDLVVFGATGFTGRLVAEYLAGRRDPALAWAIAGRNEAKLRDVRAGLARIDPALADLEILVADSADPVALAAVAARTRVVCTTVGPYARYGLPLVTACAEAGTDYCDLTGEVHFMRRSIDGCHEKAVASGARIVHACGFDSIPSDLGVLALHQHAGTLGKRLARVHLVVIAARGGFSGGTVGSILDTAAAVRHDRSLRKLLADPYALSPDRDRDRGAEGRDVIAVARDRDAGVWTAPFLMASVNTRVVRRSNVLRDWAYGRDFAYDEVMSTGRGPGGMLAAAVITAGLGTFMALAASDVTRPWLTRALPAAGEGPSEAKRAAGSFRMKLFATLQGETSPGMVCTVNGRGDPGYAATARMLSEAALQLVATHPTEASGNDNGHRGGVLTPASALGMPLVERLRKTDVTFDITTP